MLSFRNELLLLVMIEIRFAFAGICICGPITGGESQGAIYGMPFHNRFFLSDSAEQCFGCSNVADAVLQNIWL